MVARKLVISFWLLVISLFVTPIAAFAQTPTSAVLPIPSIVSPTSPLYTDLLVNNLFHTFSCLAVGQSVIGQPCLTYQVTKNAQGAIQSVPVLSQVNTSGGVLGTTTSLIGLLYVNPPVRIADYLASLGQGLGLAKEARAQGVIGSGEAVLHPILALWQVSRNVAYLVMIIIFVIIGLMVMFRQRINPQTVITAQAALPGLVIGLILITFSYFLAGLISDMAFVGTNIVGAYFSAVKEQPPQNLVQEMSGENMISIFSRFSGIIDKENASNALSSVWGYLGDNAQRLLTALAVFVTAQTTTQATELLKAIPSIGEAVQALIVGGATAATATNPTAIAGLALSFIATAILLYAMFKLLLRLINAYLNIIFLTITAPFQFMAAALPGRQGIATSWILNMLSHVLAFPAVLAVLYFVAFIVGRDFGPLQVGKINIVGNSTFPLFGGLDLDFVRIILAFGALVALPAIPDIIARTVGKVGTAGQLIGQEIGGGIGQGRQYSGQFQQGIGAGSGQVARARGLFNTPAYEPSAFDAKGNPTGFEPSKIHYQAGGISKFKQWWKNR